MSKSSSRGPEVRGITVKKKYGQHFLKDQSVIDRIMNEVHLTPTSSVFEIGCGEGILTRAIAASDSGRVWVFEIDEEWVAHVEKTIVDERVTVFHENFLDTDMVVFEQYKPWVLLANLPYQITFPILHKLQQHHDLLKEAVIMIQEEVAQKIVKKEGRGFGYTSLFFQHYFEWKLLEKIPPSAFFPSPKVHSRLVYFKPKKDIIPIDNEDEFWVFVKQCFRQPRRTLRNNLSQGHYDTSLIADDVLLLRAQQMNMDDLLKVWDLVKGKANS